MTTEASDDLTPDQMRNWLRQEIADLSKAMELRIRDATDFVTAYAVGEITAKEAAARLDGYLDRWGDDTIPGVKVTDRMTNEEIIQRSDKARSDLTTFSDKESKRTPRSQMR